MWGGGTIAGGYLALSTVRTWSSGGGRHAAESPAGMARNRGPTCGGTRGRHQAEYTSSSGDLPLGILFSVVNTLGLHMVALPVKKKK
jgi:hypothetical protein